MSRCCRDYRREWNSWRRLGRAKSNGADWLGLHCDTDPEDLWQKVVQWHSTLAYEAAHSHMDMLRYVLEELGLIKER
jgi:hypothetical protein